MSDRIRVTCEHCNRVIKAPRQSAGRTGKCPHCQNPVYVPIPQEELEEIPLASDEDSALAKADQLEKEAYEIAADIRRDLAYHAASCPDAIWLQPFGSRR